MSKQSLKMNMVDINTEQGTAAKSLHCPRSLLHMDNTKDAASVPTLDN